MVDGYQETKAVKYQELGHYVLNAIYIILEESDILQKVMTNVNHVKNII